MLDKHGLQCFAISNHLVGQAVCDRIDERHKSILPPRRVGRRQSRRRRAAGGRGDEGHRPRGGEAGREGRQRLHRQPDLAHAVLVPAESRPDSEKRAPGCSPRRWTPILDVFQEEGVQVRAWKCTRPRSPSTSARAENAARRVGRPPGLRLQLRPQPLRLPGRGLRGVHPQVRRPHLPRPHEGRAAGPDADGRPASSAGT